MGGMREWMRKDLTTFQKLSNLVWNIIFTEEKQFFMPIKSIFGLLVLVSLIVSCNQKEKVEANINSYTNVVLVQSEMVVESSIKKIIHLMNERLNTPWARDTTLVYKPKADSAIAIGNNMINYLDALIEKIKHQEEWDNRDSLFEKLNAYEKDILKIDTRVNQLFEEVILTIDTANDFKHMNREQFYNHFLCRVNKSQIVIVLNSLKQDILNNEFKMVHYFDMQCDISFEGYYKITPVIIQNSIHFRQNDELEITAGIGAFSSHSKPEFNINNKKLGIEPDGTFRYKMKVSNEKGKHIVPIRVTFNSMYGKAQEETHNVIYYVE